MATLEKWEEETDTSRRKLRRKRNSTGLEAIIFLFQKDSPGTLRLNVVEGFGTYMQESSHLATAISLLSLSIHV